MVIDDFDLTLTTPTTTKSKLIKAEKIPPQLSFFCACLKCNAYRNLSHQCTPFVLILKPGSDFNVKSIRVVHQILYLDKSHTNPKYSD